MNGPIRHCLIMMEILCRRCAESGISGRENGEKKLV